MALKDRIATGTKAVSDIFGAGGAADNVYQDLDYMARQRYAMDANQLNKQKEPIVVYVSSFVYLIVSVTVTDKPETKFV